MESRQEDDRNCLSDVHRDSPHSVFTLGLDRQDFRMLDYAFILITVERYQRLVN